MCCSPLQGTVGSVAGKDDRTGAGDDGSLGVLVPDLVLGGIDE